MENWSKASATEWLRRHAGREVSLRLRGGTFSARGICQGVNELDACSREFQQCRIALSTEQAALWLTFPDEALSVHLSLPPPGGGPAELSMTAHRPYDRLILAEPAAPGEKSPQPERKAPGKAIRTPYELLH